jgi:tetratricopeptide (TPR) repeat protein
VFLDILLLLAAIDPPVVRAEHFYLNRHLNPAWLDSAWAVTADARAGAPADPQLAILWARLNIERGDNATQSGEALKWYDRAAAVADTMRRERPDLAAGYFWWATARGSAGRVRGIINSLGILGPVRSAFERAVELDSGFALGWFALGKLYLELPPFAGGGAAKAERYLRRGVDLDPHYTIIRLELARALVRLGRRAEAAAELRTLLAEGQPTHPAEFALSDKPAAEALLAELRVRRQPAD